MKIHELKIWHTYCLEIVKGLKTFEIRKNDRNFKAGDVLHLKETKDGTNEYTGFEMLVKVEYIHQGLGMEEGYVCMAIRKVGLTL